MLNTDSIQTQGAAIADEAVAAHHSGQLTPAQVLSWLPKDATPAQQDSAIRKHIKIKPCSYSGRRDTLGTPETKPGCDTFTLSKPQWHGKSLVQKDSVYRPEHTVWRHGVAGDPIPYTLAADNVVTSMLFVCFIVAMVSISGSRQFLQRQAKNFFHIQRPNTTVMTETSNELHFQLFLILQTCLLFSLTFFYAIRGYAGQTFIIDQYLVIGCFAVIVAGYFLVKSLLYWTAGWVFFDKKKNLQWLKAFVFLSSIEGVLMYPLVMLMAYFGMGTKNAMIYMGIILILGKVLGFYKTYIIFFKPQGRFLQNILYFCTLEIVPATSLWGILIATCNYLKINF